MVFVVSRSCEKARPDNERSRHKILIFMHGFLSLAKCDFFFKTGADYFVAVLVGGEI
jgi:hypothetical protein